MLPEQMHPTKQIKKQTKIQKKPNGKTSKQTNKTETKHKEKKKKRSLQKITEQAFSIFMHFYIFCTFLTVLKHYGML